jgi:tRNA(fMet)-specific endonuclease VapC
VAILRGVLIDADVLIAAERGNLDFDGWIGSLPGVEFKLAAITVSELQHGAERGRGAQRIKREQFFQRIVPAFDVLPFTFATALIHATLWAALESRGQMIGAYDLILAATALEIGDAVATFNTRHFGQVPGLEVIKP